MTEQNSSLTQSLELGLSINRIFDAPPILVFKMWTQPEHLKQWGCPAGFKIIFSAGEVCHGGLWRMCMRSPEGKDHCVQGVYRAVVAPERIIFTHAWEDSEGKPGHETLVTVSFAALGVKTEQTFHQAVFQSIEDRDSHEEGWNECFDKLATYLPGLAMHD
ncbi:SRPBCC family protein [Nitrosospira briensis]|uniref:SRPBCC family protein n=1 Tax=Nitrosospira briensis TaxID=35799 RepID=UPI0008E6D964|nr:SRPBCC domain-containing protein [Nitrosospira briensis]SFN73957.1 Uncharacterized conserved protein YndB, AHSA1/START domain [Nitrosospira briensis]